MRLLALDYGSARCGCAVSDPTGTLVRPLKAVRKPDGREGMQALVDLVIAEDVGEIVVGLPLLESGEEGTQAAASRAFAGRLGAQIAVPIIFHDERFTTRMARESAAHGAGSDEDSLAAAHLLEGLIEARRVQSQSSQDQ